ncbi:receptor-interacting serine/threonine-protein kinase 1 isoform X2 [Rhinatrema bivittatum]|nr:receptor-interacting serine/threonine-protein kinase 1 isoform X2 [Rhinatrema bivittatum]
MSYLHKKNVIHKDLKLENILVDNDFHIKIADLGVASFQTWSKLTKEETNRHRKSKMSGVGSKVNGGTLFYMAAEHLASINAKPTVKSDVYSFGIVLWVIMAEKEPYEDALNEQQILFCIIKGDRPKIEEIKQQCPHNIKDLMQKCWEEDINKRPTFEECDQEFRPFYYQQLEMDVEESVKGMNLAYPSPKDCVVRMESLHVDCVAESSSSFETVVDRPCSLHSSQGLMVDNSVDEASFLPCIQNDPVETEVSFEDTPVSLEKKLQDELSYHQYGSRLDQMESFQNNVTNERNRRVFQEMSTVKPIPLKSQEENQRGQFNQYKDMGARNSPAYKTSDFKEASLSGQHSINSQNVGINYGTSNFSRIGNETRGFSGIAENMHDPYRFTPRTFGMSGIPKHPVPETAAGAEPKTLTLPAGTDEPLPYSSISEGSCIQIGNYNNMTVISDRPETIENTENIYSYYKELGIFNCTVLANEQHLDLIRQNLAKEWKTCARRLGLSNSEIDELDHDYERDGLREKIYQMMRKWAMKEGAKSTTVGKLAQALFGCQRTDLLNSLIDLTPELG